MISIVKAAAEGIDGGLDHEIGEAEHHALNARGQSDAKNTPAFFGVPVPTEEARLDVQDVLCRAEPAKKIDGVDHIGNEGGIGYTVDIHAESEHEGDIQHDVQHTGGDEADERRARIAAAAEDGGFEIVQPDGGQAQQIDAQIGLGHAHDFLWHAELVQKRCGKQFADEHEQQAEDQGKQNGSMHGSLYFFRLLPPNIARDDYIGAQRNAHEEAHHEPDDRRIVPHRGHGVLADELAQRQDIGCIEKLLQHACEHEGPGKDKKLAGNRTVQHIDFTVVLSRGHDRTFLLVASFYYI